MLLHALHNRSMPITLSFTHTRARAKTTPSNQTVHFANIWYVRCTHKHTQFFCCFLLVQIHTNAQWDKLLSAKKHAKPFRFTNAEENAGFVWPIARSTRPIRICVWGWVWSERQRAWKQAATSEQNEKNATALVVRRVWLTVVSCVLCCVCCVLRVRVCVCVYSFFMCFSDNRHNANRRRFSHLLRLFCVRVWWLCYSTVILFVVHVFQC